MRQTACTIRMTDILVIDSLIDSFRDCRGGGGVGRSFTSSNTPDPIRLKRGKIDRYDGLTFDYVISCTPLVFHYLLMLFSLVVHMYHIVMHLLVFVFLQ